MSLGLSSPLSRSKDDTLPLAYDSGQGMVCISRGMMTGKVQTDKLDTSPPTGNCNKWQCIIDPTGRSSPGVRIWHLVPSADQMIMITLESASNG